MPREIKAIPTSYSGIQLKSRMEAQTALLCDVLGWAWEYEPYSIMLSSGIAYIPDFRAEKYTIIETRGYVSRKGQAQIRDFAQVIVSGDGRSLPSIVDSYLVIGEGPALIAKYKKPLQPAVLFFCPECYVWKVLPASNAECEICGSADPTILCSISSRAGRITVADAFGSDQWRESLGLKSVYGVWKANAIRSVLSNSGHSAIADKLYAPEENDPATPHEQKILDAIEFIVTRDEAAE